MLKTPQGRSLVVDIAPSDTVRDVKMKVAGAEGVDPSRIRLIFTGTSLDNAALWDDCDVDAESVVHVVIAA